MGEMVGEVTLICGRVAEREIGGCSSARYRDPIVSYSEPLQGPLLLLGTVTASYYRISSPPGRGHRRAQCAPTILGTTL